MSPQDFTEAEIRVVDSDGKRRTMKWNEPRSAPPSRPSTMVEPERLGLAGVRLRAEEILAKTCGPDELDALADLGIGVRQVLVKMAVKADACDPYSRRRAAAISAIGQLGIDEAVEPLRGLASDPNETEAVRVQSVLALGRIGSDAAVDFLAHVVQTYKSPAVRGAAVKGLGSSGSLRAVSPLVQALEKDTDSDVRSRAHAEIGALEKLHKAKLADIKAPAAAPQVRQPVRNRRAEEQFRRRDTPRGR